MSKAFSVLSWNIEHLKGKRENRIARIVNTLHREDPDIFALYEVEGKTVYQSLVTKMPNYTFHITEGPQTQEILVAVKSGLTAFFSQRVSFKSGNSWLRPGALLSLRINDNDYTLLFLHLKSLTKPIGLGIRDDQFERVAKLKKKLDKANDNQPANFVALGDFNTMGMNYRGSKHDIPASAELNKLDKDIARKSVNMRRLSKSTPNTWSNGSGCRYAPSNLDHVIVSTHLVTSSWPNKRAVNEPQESFIAGRSAVDVRGWVDQGSIAEQDSWIEQFSDHCYLYFEVMKA